MREGLPLLSGPRRTLYSTVDDSASFSLGSSVWRSPRNGKMNFVVMDSRVPQLRKVPVRAALLSQERLECRLSRSISGAVLGLEMNSPVMYAMTRPVGFLFMIDEHPTGLTGSWMAYGTMDIEARLHCSHKSESLGWMCLGIFDQNECLTIIPQQHVYSDYFSFYLWK
eukprot:Gb_39739 [translate_table: standard]